jgi:hypothetical protein
MDALDLPALAARGLGFWAVLDCAMSNVPGATERDRFVDGVETLVPAGELICLLGDARRRSDTV